MFAQPPFPGTSALRRESEAQRNKFQALSTDNLNVSTSPRYTLRPIRFSVYGRITPSTFGVNEEPQYAQVNIPDIHFPPEGAMTIELESVKHRPGFQGWINVDPTGNRDFSTTISSNGFIVETDGLAAAGFTPGGIQQREFTFFSGPGLFYSPVESPEPVQTYYGAGGNALGMHYFAGKKLDQSTISPPFAHSNMNFSFAFRLVDTDKPAFEDAWNAINNADGGRDAMEITFVVKPDPYWQQRY